MAIAQPHQELEAGSAINKDVIKNQSLYQCSICNKSFTHQRSLSRHTLIKHSERKSYVCQFCGIGCLRQDALLWHERERHYNKRRNPKGLTALSPSRAPPRRSYGAELEIADVDETMNKAVAWLNYCMPCHDTDSLYDEQIDDGYVNWLDFFPRYFREDLMGSQNAKQASQPICPPESTVADSGFHGSSNMDCEDVDVVLPRDDIDAHAPTKPTWAWLPQRPLRVFHRMASRSSSPLCTLCWKPFETNDMNVLKQHLERHSVSPGDFTCSICRVDFVHIKDFNYHRMTANMGQCGYGFAHSAPCTGHHRPEAESENSAILATDRMRMVYQIRNWEQAQLQAYIYAVTNVLAVTSGVEDAPLMHPFSFQVRKCKSNADDNEVLDDVTFSDDLETLSDIGVETALPSKSFTQSDTEHLIAERSPSQTQTANSHAVLEARYESDSFPASRFTSSLDVMHSGLTDRNQEACAADEDREDQACMVGRDQARKIDAPPVHFCYERAIKNLKTEVNNIRLAVQQITPSLISEPHQGSSTRSDSGVEEVDLHSVRKKYWRENSPRETASTFTQRRAISEPPSRSSNFHNLRITGCALDGAQQSEAGKEASTNSNTLKQAPTLKRRQARSESGDSFHEDDPERKKLQTENNSGTVPGKRGLPCIFFHKYPFLFPDHNVRFAHISGLRGHLQSKHHFYTCRRCIYRYETKNELSYHERDCNSLLPCTKACTDRGCRRWIHPYNDSTPSGASCLCIKTTEGQFQELVARIRRSDISHLTPERSGLHSVDSGTNFGESIASNEDIRRVDEQTRSHELGQPARMAPLLHEQFAEAPITEADDLPLDFDLSFAFNSSMGVGDPSNSQDAGVSNTCTDHDASYPMIQDNLQALEDNMSNIFSGLSGSESSMIANIPSLGVLFRELQSQIKSLREMTDAREDIKEIQTSIGDLRAELARAKQHITQPSSRERELERQIKRREAAISILWDGLETAEGTNDHLRHQVNQLAPNVIPDLGDPQNNIESVDASQQFVDPRELMGKGKQPDWQTPRPDSAYHSR